MDAVRQRAYPHRTHVIGRLVFGWSVQAGNAPIIDGATTVSVDGWRAGSVVIRLPRTPGRALMIGWIGARAPIPGRGARLPLVGRLLRMRH